MAKDRHEDERLTDNTKIRYCEQCEGCAMWGIGDDPYTNQYDKSNCAMFPYPGIKPTYVINNTSPCEWRVPKG